MRRTNRSVFMGAFLLTSTSFFVVCQHYGQADGDISFGTRPQVSYVFEEIHQQETISKSIKDDPYSFDKNTLSIENELFTEKTTYPEDTICEESSTDGGVSSTENEEASDGSLETDTLSIIAVGDDLIHTQVIKSGKQKDGSYDFSHLFLGISEEIDNADLAIINQETILCDQSLGYTGYPTFGSPYEVGDAIHEAGFDVVLHATNHTADKGVEGVMDTLEYWKQYDDIDMVGISESEKLSDRVVIIDRNGIKVSILNYTYGLNGLKLPSGYDYLINRLDKKQMKKDIAYAKKKSDFVIVCPHWGTEYVYKPTQQQEDYTTFFLNQGVDLVIGTHPHVLEPVEWVEKEDGSHRMLVYYSLGNFVSNQDAMARMLGGMAKITLKRIGTDVVIDDAQIEPLVTHTYYDGVQRFVTYPLQYYTENMAKVHYLNRKKKSTITKDKLEELTKHVLGDWFAYSNIS